jgi:hypothetical protein
VTRFIDENRAGFGVEAICRTLEVSASAYYQRNTGQRSARQVHDKRLLDVIQTTHKNNFEAYGPDFHRCEAHEDGQKPV